MSKKGVAMSTYLRRTRTVHIGRVVAKVEFGTEVHCGRLTVTVLMVTAQHRRTWKRAIERLGIVATQCDAAGPHPESGEPRTISFSCQGEAWALEELSKLYVVESWNDSEAAIPFRCAGSGPEKQVKREDRVAIVRNGSAALI
jgi:hypothetical protein